MLSDTKGIYLGEGGVRMSIDVVAILIGSVISVVLSVWVARDARRRQTRVAPFWWGLGVFLFWMLFFPLYLARRPLKAGEVRRGGKGWNFMKNLAIVISVYAPVVLLLGSVGVASEATSAQEAAALMVGVVLLVGLVWLVFAGGTLALGLILKKPSVIERGPPGPRAQASGWQSTEPHSVEQTGARRHLHSGIVKNVGSWEHHGAYGELASVKEIVDLSPQQALDEAQTFLVRQGYSIMQRRGESLTVQRRFPNQTVEQNTLNLTVTALHQPERGVRISVRGNDREGVKEWQSAWTEWSEGLPKK